MGPYDPARHESLRPGTWDPAQIRDAIAAICRDAEAAFDPATLWPSHPRDREADDAEDRIFRGLYLGAAGMVHALHRLAEAGLYVPTLDLARVVDGLDSAARIEPDEVDAASSLLLGCTGVLLVSHRLTGRPELADRLAGAIAENVEHPSNEPLLGSPGTMLAARTMFGRTGEERFAQLWRASAKVLLARQDSDGLWTQDMYGERLRYVGPGHGFAGNVAALLGAPEWLEDAEAVEALALSVTRRLAVTDQKTATWLPLVDGSGSVGAGPPRVQWCHGAPGMVISLAGLGRDDAAYGQLLRAGGEFVWRAGPITAIAGLCHGTAGNGFAFLSLLRRTGDELWLERAQSFARHALDQVARWRGATGSGRYSLFTGDMGPALLAAACLNGGGAFPGLEDL